MRDKQGKKITVKEFFHRWKEGISMLTPIQKLENDVRATFIMLVGYALSFVALIVYRNAFPNKWLNYGLIIIFLGAMWSNGIKWFATRQQLRLFKQMDVQAVEVQSLNDVINSKKVKKGGKTK